MLQKLTAVAPRDNDALTLRRGNALALVMLLFLILGSTLASISLVDRDLPALINSTIGLGTFMLVFAINRSGRVRSAVVILLTGGTIITISGAIISQRPI